MRINNRNRISKDSKAKKKLILEKMKECLQDISAKENAKIQNNKIKLSNAEKRAKQKAEYEASRVLTNERQKELDDILLLLMKASTPEDKVKEAINILDVPNRTIEIINRYKSYVIKVCPEFYEIMNLYSKARKLPMNEQESVLIEEYKKYLNDKAKQNFVWGAPFLPEKDVSN
jgi:hypothetical protein